MVQQQQPQHVPVGSKQPWNERSVQTSNKMANVPSAAAAAAAEPRRFWDGHRWISENENTIIGKLGDDCCGCFSAKFDIRYDEGRTSLTQNEFESAVAEFNNAVKKPGWWYPLYPLCICFHLFTCQGCDPTKKDGCCDFVLETVAKRMSTKYAHKGVQFFIRLGYGIFHDALEQGASDQAVHCCRPLSQYLETARIYGD